MDEDSHEVTREGQEIRLTATEFELLRYFMRNPKRVLSKAQILDHVWRYDFGGQPNIVELYVSYLRRKVDAGRVPMIHALRGIGHVLKPPGAQRRHDGRGPRPLGAAQAARRGSDRPARGRHGDHGRRFGARPAARWSVARLSAPCRSERAGGALGRRTGSTPNADADVSDPDR
jgi:hypothetical protein